MKLTNLLDFDPAAQLIKGKRNWGGGGVCHSGQDCWITLWGGIFRFSCIQKLISLMQQQPVYFCSTLLLARVLWLSITSGTSVERQSGDFFAIHCNRLISTLTNINAWDSSGTSRIIGKVNTGFGVPSLRSSNPSKDRPLCITTAPAPSPNSIQRGSSQSTPAR